MTTVKDDKKIQISTATFISASPSLQHCPKTDLPEFAFIGRSNVGKSSLINMVTGNKKLAKVSGTPGKTRLINHFLINNSWYLVDLPGYGFAKTSKTENSKIGTMIENYLLRRETLRLTFLLIDSRHLPQNIDITFISWLTRNKIPFLLLFTKADKITKALHTSNPSLYLQTLHNTLNINPQYILTSAQKKLGRPEILTTIHNLLALNT